MPLLVFRLATKLLPESEEEQSGKSHPIERRDYHPGKALAGKELVLKNCLSVSRAAHLFCLKQPGPTLCLGYWRYRQRQTFSSNGWRGDDVRIIGELRFVLWSGLPNPPDRNRLAGLPGHGHGHIGRKILLLERR